MEFLSAISLLKVKHLIIITLGPLTYTKDGKTTLYGVVHGPASLDVCDGLGIFIRLSASVVLDWINGFM